MNKLNLLKTNQSRVLQKLWLLSVVVFFFACSENTTVVNRNIQIEKDKRTQIKLLNDQLVDAVLNNKIEDLKKIMVNEFISDTNIVIISSISNQLSTLYKSSTYSILDEYNVINPKSRMVNSVVSVATDNNDYLINYFSETKESYVSLILLKGVEMDFLITAFYGKLENKWRLFNWEFGKYRSYNYTAPNFHQLATESYDQFRLIEAQNYSNMAVENLYPASDFFIFIKQNEILEFNGKVASEVKRRFQFPVTLYNIPSHPKVIEISPRELDHNIIPQIKEQGFYTTVFYLTDINIKDKQALTIENDKIKKEVRTIFNKINMDKKQVLYMAYSKWPTEFQDANSVAFVETLTD